MNCRDWEERLALYAEGDLAKEEAAQVERHLGECPGCQMYSSGLKESQVLLQEAHREPLAPAHFAAVRARVLADLERERRPFWRHGWVFGFALVAAGLVALSVLPPVRSWLLPGHRPVPKPPVVALEHPPAVSAGGLAAGVLVPAGNLATPAARRVASGRPSHLRRAREKAESNEPILIKMVSDNPDVVIYWIANTKGE